MTWWWSWKKSWFVIDPFTAPACQISNFQTEECKHRPANSIFSGPITVHLSGVCVLIRILSHANSKKKKKKKKRISNFALLLVVFNWHHGSKRVKPKFCICLLHSFWQPWFSLGEVGMTFHNAWKDNLLSTTVPCPPTSPLTRSFPSSEPATSALSVDFLSRFRPWSRNLCPSLANSGN